MPRNTPGPWKATPPVNTPRFFQQTWEVVPAADPLVSIASVNGLDNEENIDFEIVKADAILLASAPDLLETLEAVVEDVMSTSGSHLSARVAKMVRDAIAKAKGDRAWEA